MHRRTTLAKINAPRIDANGVHNMEEQTVYNEIGSVGGK